MKRFRTLAGKARDAQNFDKAAEYFRKANAIEAGIPRPGTGVYRSAVKNSQRVSRTELNNAFHEGTKAYHRTKPWIIGDKWNLSSGHTIVDICDEYARTDYHGLGAGIFPPGESPRIPHPHCLCFITSVLDWAYLGMTNPELQAAA